MIEKTSLLLPYLHESMELYTQAWPTYDGKELDRTKFVSSSDTGKCARQIWYGKNIHLIEGNFIQKKFPWGYAQRGHAHEAWIVERLAALESPLLQFEYTGQDQVSFYEGKQSGTPDGLMTKWVTDLPARYTLEFKSIDPRTKLSNLPKKEHLDQVIQNSELMEACLDIEIDGGYLCYSNASDFSTVTEFFVNTKSQQAIDRAAFLEDRAYEIMAAPTAEDVSPEGLYTGGCKQCDFASVCTGATKQKQMERENYVKHKSGSSKFFG